MSWPTVQKRGVDTYFAGILEEQIFVKKVFNNKNEYPYCLVKLKLFF